MARFILKRRVIVNAYKPRSYQQGCLNNLRAARRAGKKKALIVMASGLGKTLTGVFDVKQLFAAQPNGRVLMLCHSEAILSQTKEVFKKTLANATATGCIMVIVRHPTERTFCLQICNP